jgi:hypothetical protein
MILILSSNETAVIEEHKQKTVLNEPFGLKGVPMVGFKKHSCILHVLSSKTPIKKAGFGRPLK